MNSKNYIVTSDFTKQFNEVIKSLRGDRVLVGIPSEDGAREGSGQITNAGLLALNNFGSPANNIPARPVMDIGIRKVQNEIAKTFRSAAISALSGGAGEVTAAYNRAGSIAANSVKKAINSQEGIAPPSPATLAARESAGFRGTKALIVTGQMRNAITYVVRD